MKNYSIKLVTTMMIMLFLYACSESEIATDEDIETAFKEINSLKQTPEHQALFEYARLLSITIAKHEGTNELLQKKALQLKRIGYYEQEFYVGMEDNESAKEFGNKSLVHRLVNIGENDVSTQLKKFNKTNPGMSVLLVGDAKVKGFSNRVYVDNDFDDRNEFETIYYYENGILHTTSLSEKPALKAFVVRNSEVYIDEEKSQYEKYANQPTMTLFSYKDGRSVKINQGAIKAIIAPPNDDDELGGGDGGGGGGGGGGSGSGGTPPCTATCERDCEDKTENLWRFRTEDDYDGFLRGSGEWYFIFLWGDSNYTYQNGTVVLTGSALNSVRKGTITGVCDDNSWYYPNFDVIMWNITTSATNPIPDGNRMKVVCFEDDGGGNQTVNASLSFEILGINLNLSTNFTIDDGDDFIGEYIVDYCQDIGSNGFIYHPSGAVDVQHNER